MQIAVRKAVPEGGAAALSLDKLDPRSMTTETVQNSSYGRQMALIEHAPGNLGGRTRSYAGGAV